MEKPFLHTALPEGLREGALPKTPVLEICPPCPYFRQVLDLNEVWVLFYSKSKPRASSPGLVHSDPGGGGVGGVVTLRRDFSTKCVTSHQQGEV